MKISTQELSESMLKSKLSKKKDGTDQVGHQAKVGFINLNRILQETAEGKKRGEKLKKLAQDRERFLENKAAEVEKLQKQGGGAKLTVQKKIEELHKLRTEAQQEIDRLQQEALMEMEQITIPILQQLIQERGLSMILSYPQPGVVFVSENLDITKELIVRLNG